LEALIEEGNQKYELGLILDKAALKRVFEAVDVSLTILSLSCSISIY
jgi:hypothetical protein